MGIPCAHFLCVLSGACTSPGCARFGGPPSGGLPKRAQPGEVWALDAPYLFFLWDPFGGIPGVELVHVTPQLFKTDASNNDPECHTLRTDPNAHVSALHVNA